MLISVEVRCDIHKACKVVRSVTKSTPAEKCTEGALVVLVMVLLLFPYFQYITFSRWRLLVCASSVASKNWSWDTKRILSGGLLWTSNLCKNPIVLLPKWKQWQAMKRSDSGGNIPLTCKAEQSRTLAAPQSRQLKEDILKSLQTLELTMAREGQPLGAVNCYK